MSGITTNIRLETIEPEDNVSVDPFNNNFNRIDNYIGQLSNDYVYESGYGNLGWYYRKWASGFAECWRITEVKDVGKWAWWVPKSESEYTQYAESKKYFNYPKEIIFDEVPMEFVTCKIVNNPTYTCWLANTGGQANTRTANYWIVSAGQKLYPDNLKFQFMIYVAGKCSPTSKAQGIREKRE